MRRIKELPVFILQKREEKIAENMDDALHQLEKEAFANMSEQEIMLLHRLLLQMKENLIKGEKD